MALTKAVGFSRGRPSHSESSEHSECNEEQEESESETEAERTETDSEEERAKIRQEAAKKACETKAVQRPCPHVERPIDEPSRRLRICCIRRAGLSLQDADWSVAPMPPPSRKVWEFRLALSRRLGVEISELRLLSAAGNGLEPCLFRSGGCVLHDDDAVTALVDHDDILLAIPQLPHLSAPAEAAATKKPLERAIHRARNDDVTIVEDDDVVEVNPALSQPPASRATDPSRHRHARSPMGSDGSRGRRRARRRPDGCRSRGSKRPAAASSRESKKKGRKRQKAQKRRSKHDDREAEKVSPVRGDTQRRKSEQRRSRPRRRRSRRRSRSRSVSQGSRRRSQKKEVEASGSGARSHSRRRSRSRSQGRSVSQGSRRRSKRKEVEASGSGARSQSRHREEVSDGRRLVQKAVRDSVGDHALRDLQQRSERARSSALKFLPLLD